MTRTSHHPDVARLIPFAAALALLAAGCGRSGDAPVLPSFSTGGAGKLTLTDGPHLARSPRISPDGTKVVFERHDFARPEAVDVHKAPDAIHVAVVPTAGGDTILVPESSGGVSPSFTREGRVAFLRGRTLVLSTIDGRADAPTALDGVSPSIGRPHISPDGTRLAYLSPPEPRVTDDYDPDLHAPQAHVIRLKDRVVRRVSFGATNAVEEYDVGWADDDTVLVYRHERARSARFHRVARVRVPRDDAAPVSETLGWFSDIFDATAVALGARRIVTSDFRRDMIAFLDFSETHARLVPEKRVVNEIALAPDGTFAVVALIDAFKGQPGRPVHLVRISAPDLDPVAGALAAVGNPPAKNEEGSNTPALPQ